MSHPLFCGLILGLRSGLWLSLCGCHIHKQLHLPKGLFE